MIYKLVVCFFIPLAWCKFKYSTQVRFTVDENQPIGSEIGLINGTSVNYRDKPLFLPIMRYPIDSYFLIDSYTGRIRLKKTLDRETVCPDSPKDCAMNFKVKLVSNEQVMDISIFIIDINDNVPKFPEDEYRLKISESSKIGFELFLPTATDKDSEMHGIIKYRIISDSMNRDIDRDFTINIIRQSKMLVPILKQIRNLDRETIPKYKFYLRAEDTDGKYGEALINLDVDDANDNYPQWNGLPYQVTVKECEKLNKDLIVLEANDLDQGGYGSVTYKINPLADAFVKSHFHLYGKKLFLSTSLDYENNLHRKILVPVSAIDEGGLANTTNVEVKVEDCNDNNPIISVVNPKFINGNSYYNSHNDKLSIDENNEKEINIVSIDVTDADSGENGRVSCELETYKEFFKLVLLNDDSDKGLLFTLVKNLGYSFDREKTSTVKVDISCRDNGLSPRTSRQPLMILINDVNDNDPRLISGFSFDIQENNENGALVGRFEATDIDENENKPIEFSLIYESVENTFQLTKDGFLNAIRKLDRESVSKYKLGIRLLDTKEPRRNSTYNITINVTDDNDGVPMYAGERSFRIMESYGESISQVVIAQLHATDSDESLNGAIEFILDSSKIVPHVLRNAYSLSKNGLLTARGNLDREKTPIHQLLIIIQDKGHKPQSTTVQITIHLMDMNDNKPMFTFPNEKENSINVTVDLAPGTMVTMIKAEDRDLGNNGTVQFECRPQSNFFAVNPNGEVILKALLGQTNGHFSPRHAINIRAFDLGNRSLQEHTQLIVYVSDTLAESSRKGELYDNSPNNNDKNRNEENGIPNFNSQQKRKHMNIIILMIMVVFVMITFFAVVAVLSFIYFKKERFTFFGTTGSHRHTEKTGANYSSHKTNQPYDVSRLAPYPNLTSNPINEYTTKEGLCVGQYPADATHRNSANFYNTLILPESRVCTFQNPNDEYQNRNPSVNSVDLQQKIALLNYSNFFESEEYRDQDKKDYFSLNHNIPNLSTNNVELNQRLNNFPVQSRTMENDINDCRIEYKTPQLQKRSIKINSSFV